MSRAHETAGQSSDEAFLPGHGGHSRAAEHADDQGGRSCGQRQQPPQETTNFNNPVVARR